MKQAERIPESKREKETILDVFVSNLDPDLAKEVRESWINPSKFTAGRLLGKGKQAHATHCSPLVM